jgi:hypothetical protein
MFMTPAEDHKQEFQSFHVGSIHELVCRWLQMGCLEAWHMEEDFLGASYEGGIMEEAWRRNYGEGMVEKSWMRNHDSR